MMSSVEDYQQLSAAGGGEFRAVPPRCQTWRRPAQLTLSRSWSAVQRGRVTSRSHASRDLSRQFASRSAPSLQGMRASPLPDFESRIHLNERACFSPARVAGPARRLEKINT